MTPYDERRVLDVARALPGIASVRYATTAERAHGAHLSLRTTVGHGFFLRITSAWGRGVIPPRFKADLGNPVEVVFPETRAERLRAEVEEACNRARHRLGERVYASAAVASYVAKQGTYRSPVDRAAYRARVLDVVARFGFACVYCGTPTPLDELTMDHLLPRSRGGSDDVDNLVPACGDCNQAKGSMSVDGFLGLIEAVRPGECFRILSRVVEALLT